MLLINQYKIQDWQVGEGACSPAGAAISSVDRKMVFYYNKILDS
jgi:hypothetical protein